MEKQKHKILEEYVTKMLKVQKERFEQNLSLSELKEIAHSVGMSEKDWEAAQEVMKDHLQRARGHLQNANWIDAIKELEQAVAINPYHEEALYGLAKAHYEQFKNKAKEDDRLAAEAYADRALKNEENHYDSATIALLNSIRHAQASHIKKRNQLYIRLGAVLGSIVVIIGLTYLIMSSSINAKAEAVNQQWAQVETVCQRRADLIPKVVSVVKAAAKYDQKKLDKLITLQKTLNPANKEQYIAQQEHLEKILTSIFAELEMNPSLFKDLQVQIEGAENRISVERRKYNKIVSEYNTTVSCFPMNLLGFGKKEYFKSNAENVNPAVTF